MIYPTRTVRVWFGPVFLLCSLVGVDPTEQILSEQVRPEVSVPIAQAVGDHAEARGVLREVLSMKSQESTARGVR